LVTDGAGLEKDRMSRIDVGTNPVATLLALENPDVCQAFQFTMNGAWK
jgi:hypothetical protein